MNSTFAPSLNTSPRQAAAQTGPEKCPPQLVNHRPSDVKTLILGKVSAQQAAWMSSAGPHLRPEE
jgi:hypothetical protein